MYSSLGLERKKLNLKRLPIKHPSFIWVLSLFLFSFFSFVTNLTLSRISSHLATTDVYHERQYKLNPDIVRAFSFGHLPSIIDWLWIHSVIESPITHLPKGEHPQFYYDVDLISDLDPAHLDVYINGANLLTIIRDDNVGAKEILLKGKAFFREKLPSYPSDFKNKYWSTSWNIHTALAYIYLFELDDMPSAASEFLEASSLPGAPAYLISLEKRLRQKGGSYEVGIRLLEFLINGQGKTDPQLKKTLEEKLHNLSINYYLFQINDAYQNYLEKNKSQRLLTYFLKTAKIKEIDPWGGKIFITNAGKLNSTTPHKQVFHLD